MASSGARNQHRKSGQSSCSTRRLTPSPPSSAPIWDARFLPSPARARNSTPGSTASSAKGCDAVFEGLGPPKTALSAISQVILADVSPSTSPLVRTLLLSPPRKRETASLPNKKLIADGRPL